MMQMGAGKGWRKGCREISSPFDLGFSSARSCRETSSLKLDVCSMEMDWQKKKTGDPFQVPTNSLIVDIFSFGCLVRQCPAGVGEDFFVKCP